MHENCSGKSSRASESSCPTTPGLLAEGVIMCSFVKEWLWWMLMYIHILTIATCIWLHIIHQSRNCFEAPQSKKISRGNKEGKACCDSVHWHTTCNPRITEAHHNVQLADEVTPHVGRLTSSWIMSALDSTVRIVGLFIRIMSGGNYSRRR